LVVVAAAAAGMALVSGDSSTDPRTPAALPGMPPPFLGTAVVGDGAVTAAIDSYGDVVDLRAAGPAGSALIDNPADRQAAGTVAADTGIVPRVRIGGGNALPMWRADSVWQRYVPGTNVVRTVARFGLVRVTITDAAEGDGFARLMEISDPPGVRAAPVLGVDVEEGSRCRRERWSRAIDLVCSPRDGERPPNRRIDSLGVGNEPASVAEQAAMTLRAARFFDRDWVRRAQPLGRGAPNWATEMYRRSLLTLRALTDARTGAVAAGARDGWAYVWPRDAATAVLAFDAAGYRSEARRAARFLLGLDLGAAARFEGDGTPVAGREAQGDAGGWIAAAAEATGLPARRESSPGRDPADYQEGDPGDYLGNAIASTSAGIAREFSGHGGLVRVGDDPGSGLDSAAAWAVRPFALPSLYPEVRKTLIALTGAQTRFGITPGEGWSGDDPWTAPTAWTAWSLAALGERRQALRLLGDLRRAATPAGGLPERVDARTGVPRSTTPLAWSHAFAILALRGLWPGG
jgi:hypothetical protein